MPDKKERYMFLTGEMHLDHALEEETYQKLSSYIMDYYDEKDAYMRCTNRLGYVAKRKGNIMPFSIPFKKCPASDVCLFVNGFLKVLSDEGYDVRGMLTLHDRKDYVIGLIYIEGGRFTVDTSDEKKGILRATVGQV